MIKDRGAIMVGEREVRRTGEDGETIVVNLGPARFECF